MVDRQNIIRVFARRTHATPDDANVFVGLPPLEVTRRSTKFAELHVSCTFTWDRNRCQRLAEAWGQYALTVFVDGPAYGNPGYDFEPGLYIKPGYVITTRGCPNHCQHCLVPEREGKLRCLPIREGWNVLDNNLLAAPRSHIEAVLDMLSRQRRAATFTGGLEAARIEPWFIEAITAIHFRRLFVAYDQPADRRPMADAIALIRYFGHRHDKIGCYVLCGYAGDTIPAAAARLQDVRDRGGTPYPMYFQPPDSDGKRPPEWREFVGRAWKSLGACDQRRRRSQRRTPYLFAVET